MRSLCLCLSLLFFVVSSRAAQHAAPAYRISGLVIDAVTRAPVPHAEVTISVAAEETKTTSGEDGRFVFQGVEPGKYPLFAEAQGYIREGHNQHGAFLTAIVVGDGMDSEHIILRLHRQALITGKVTDERGEAVRHAQVMLFGNDKTSGKHVIPMRAQTQTNDLGEYRFAHLPAGKYYVAAQAQPWYAQPTFRYVREPEQTTSSFVRTLSKPDSVLDVAYPITFYPGVKESDAAADLNLTAGDVQIANIQILAVPAVHLRLTSLPADAERGISISATQKLFGSSNMPISLATIQISPGEYEVAGFPAGEVTLVVNGNGNQEQHSRTIKANLSGGEALDAAESAGLRSVSGRVILTSGEWSATRGRVMLSSADGQSATAALRKDGTFSFSPLQEGTYKVFVNSSARGEYVRSISASGAKISGREITITGSAEVQMSIAMASGQGEITGVAKLAGKPAPGMMVLLTPASGQNLEEDSRVDQSDSDGTFSLRGILPGKYSLMAIEDGWDLDWTNTGDLKPYLEKAQSLLVSASDQLKMAVEVQPLRQAR